jgi:hypothetical protein
VNCGGEVKALVMKATSVVSESLRSNMASDFVNRECFRQGCQGLATKSIKYFYTGKTIVMAPAPKIQDRDAQDLCPIHAQEFTAPNTWTLVHKASLPSFLDSGAGSSMQVQSSSDGSFGVVLLVIIFFAAIIFLGWQIVSWIFSQDWSSDGTPIRIRFPIRRKYR